MVNIHMHDSNSDEWIRGLDIPLEDIKRLTLRPLKWLRFVAFAVLGAKGDLLDSPAPTRSVVDYETSFGDMGENYYYFPDGAYHLVDYNGLADKITSSAHTGRDPRFHPNVALRDGNVCVITRVEAKYCQAAHIIPHSKGDEYISFVVSDRRGLYEDEDHQVRIPADLNIDSTENGIFLNTLLHSRFGQGECVFLRTPNFALDPADIPRVETGSLPTSRTTFQHLKQWDALDPPLQRDVRVDWSVLNAPPNILLDYVYGVAIVQLWATPDTRDLLKQRYEEAYANPPQSATSPPSEDDDNDDSVESDGPTDVPPRHHRKRRHVSRQKSLEAERCQAMDMAFAFSMFFRGYPAGTTFEMVRQKQVEAAEVHTRQMAQEKVQEWLGASASLSGRSGSGE